MPVSDTSFPSVWTAQEINRICSTPPCKTELPIAPLHFFNTPQGGGTDHFEKHCSRWKQKILIARNITIEAVSVDTKKSDWLWRQEALIWHHQVAFEGHPTYVFAQKSDFHAGLHLKTQASVPESIACFLLASSWWRSLLCSSKRRAHRVRLRKIKFGQAFGSGAPGGIYEVTHRVSAELQIGWHEMNSIFRKQCQAKIQSTEVICNLIIRL